MNNRTITCCLLALSAIPGTNLINAQVPARDNFNILFENNYNDDQLGNYISADFVSDWRTPAGSSPDGKIEILNDNAAHGKMMRAYYPSGTLLPSKDHGFTWYSYLSSKGDEIYFSYDIRFKPGFEWVHGGKIPGVVGGAVTSGQPPTSTSGFSTRMMWKGGGHLVFYVYHHDQASNYGDTYFWDGFQFQTDKWYNLTIRVVLNSVESGTAMANGILEGYADGRLIFQKTDFRFRLTESIKIEKMYLCSFFGGNTLDWAAIRDEWMDSDNYICFTYSDKASNVPRGRQKNTTGYVLHPYYDFLQSGTIEDPVVPQAPSALTSMSHNSSTVELSWKDNSNIEEGFQLYRSLSQTDGFTQVAACGPDETSCIDSMLSPGTAYYYKLRAFNNDGNSAFTTVVKATTLSAIVVSDEKKIYIDPDNTDDPHANGTEFHPYDSWSKVQWKDGYAYLQKKGTTASVSGIQIGASNIILGSYGEGSLPVITSETSTYLISGFEKTNVVIRELDLRASDAISCIYFLGSSTDRIIMERCNITGNVNAIKVIDGVALTLRYNNISSRQEGIFSTARDNDIYYNIFKACENAVNITGNSSRARIFNNVFTDNMKSVSVSYAELTLHNNIFYMTSGEQKALNHGTGKLVSDNNIFYPEQAGFISVAGKYFDNLNEYQKSMKVDLKSFVSDPQFADLVNNNYKLASTSPAINSGKNMSVTEDYAGIKVPLFGKTDLGIYEFDGNLAQNPIENESLSLKLYPNPSTGPVTVEAQIIDESLIENEPEVGIKELRVLDITGKTILTKKINEVSSTLFQDHVDLSGYKEGLYFVVVQIADKLIREKVLITK